ncbi:MAG TPA: cell division protein ZapE [Rhizomicrobium sp.]
MSARVVLDAAQQAAAKKLDALAAALRQPLGDLQRLFGRRQSSPRGIYLWGAVGRGKTMLMDHFFERVEIAPKRRVHFNAFMVETHARIHEWRGLEDGARTRRPEFVREAGDDPIPPIARGIASQAKLLCLDEFEVRDVADAMILGRLFEQVLTRGVTIVVTSNTPPQRLYEGGLNRQLFIPFIAVIEQRLEVIELQGARDYRLGRMAGRDLYVTPLDSKADAELDRIWSELTDGAAGEPETVEVLGRTIQVPRAAHGAARFSFDALCESPLAAADYLSLVRRYHVLMIDCIPQMGPHRRDAARRFTLLVDTLYDENVKLVCSAATPPATLYRGDDPESFRRTASRLVEMQSRIYLERNGASVR